MNVETAARIRLYKRTVKWTNKEALIIESILIFLSKEFSPNIMPPSYVPVPAKPWMGRIEVNSPKITATKELSKLTSTKDNKR